MFPLARALIIPVALAGGILLQPRSFAPDIDAPSRLSSAVLVGAIEKNDRLLLSLCLAEGVDANVRGPAGRTPLLLATLQQQDELIDQLLAAGANVDMADDMGLTPVMVAATQGNSSLLKRFIARSVWLDATDQQGWTAVHHAIATQRHEAVAMLMPAMPPLDEVYAAGGADLLAVACERGDGKVVEAILKRSPDELPWTKQTREALDNALKAGNKELVSLLLEKHPSTPTLEGSALPLLAQAIATDDVTAFDALLAGGADPNTVLPAKPEKSFVSLLPANYLRAFVNSDNGITVLMLAAGLGKGDFVRALLDAGAERNRFTTRHKMLALYFASRTKNWECVQMLLGGGPLPDKLRVEISLAKQRAAVFRDGVSILETAISTGRKGYDTPAGDYVITDKSVYHRSSIYHVNMPYFMRLNCLDFGMHAGVVPNYPASHGCIRLPSDVARKIFSEIPVGTLVSIN